MPVVSKQSPKPSPKKPATRSKVVPIGELSDSYGFRGVFYGKSKTGKTTLFGSFPGRKLLVGTMGTLEDGTLSVRDVPDMDFYPMTSPDDMDDVVDIVINDGYESVGLDTGGGLQQMVFCKVTGVDEAPVQLGWGSATQQQWGAIGAQTKEWLRRLLALSMTHSKKVAIIAHERNFNDEGGSELISPTVGAALSPSVTGWLNGAVDYIGQCFLREQTREVTQKVNGKDVTITQKSGKTEYCLRIGPHAVYITGFRKPRSNVIPDVITDPSYAKIMKVIQGKSL